MWLLQFSQIFAQLNSANYAMEKVFILKSFIAYEYDLWVTINMLYTVYVCLKGRF